VEFFKYHCSRTRGFDQLTTERYYFCHLEIPEWAIECYKKIGILIFGCGVEQLTTEIAKYSVGRLRPHFFAVREMISDCSIVRDWHANHLYNFRFVNQSSMMAQHAMILLILDVILRIIHAKEVAVK